MEQAPHDPEEQATPQYLPDSEAGERGEAPDEREPDIEFGQLSFMSPEGIAWNEFVITRGIEAAERDERPIDDRTASYIATFLGRAATPALRTLATTGAVYKASLEEEIVSLIFDQTAQVQRWIGWFANYYLNREDHGPVENWREDIAQRDRAEAELLRRERILDELDDLFACSADDELAGVEELGWFGLLHHDRTPGGWILHQQARDDSRDVFETDSDAELNESWRNISQRYLEMYWRSRPIATATGEADSSGGDGTPRSDDPDSPKP